MPNNGVVCARVIAPDQEMRLVKVKRLAEVTHFRRYDVFPEEFTRLLPVMLRHEEQDVPWVEVAVDNAMAVHPINGLRNVNKDLRAGCQPDCAQRCLGKGTVQIKVEFLHYGNRAPRVPEVIDQ